MFIKGVYFANYTRKDQFFIFWREKNDCQTKKSVVLNSPKIANISKGLVHLFCQKIEYFISSLYFADQTRKDRFLIFWREKNDCQTQKSEVLKSPKHRNFSKGLVHGFCQRIEYLIKGIFLGKLSHKALFLDVLDRKECFLDHIHSFKNSKNRKFFELVSPRSIFDILDRKE